MTYNYTTKGTCSTEISFELDGDIVKNVRFLGGCQGNLQAIQNLVDGYTITEIESKCKGIHCGRKMTSCADQLSIAVREAFDRA